MDVVQALVVLQAAAAALPQVAKAVNDLIAMFQAAGAVTDADLASARADAAKSVEDLKTAIDQDLQP